MACIYIYKGHTFNSEMELDDFILERLPFEPTMGDLVFEMPTTYQINVANQLSLISKESYAERKKYKEMLDSGKVIYDADGEMAVEDPPYIGVNKFLSGLKNAAGELLFPEFREEEYWKRRYSNWKIGSFNDVEIEEFGLDKDNLPKVTDESIHKKYREQMTNKWKTQAKTGTAIHNILQTCFQKNKKIYNFSLDEAELEKVVLRNIPEKDKPYIKGDVVKQTIAYAKELSKNLKDKFGEDCAFYPEFMITENTNVMHKGTPTKLMGIVDLLIVDGTGKIHILDYKTSIHDHNQFTQAKKNSYSYQLATYQRMFEKKGLNTYETQLLVAPIQITDFKKDVDGSYTYSGILAPATLTSVGDEIHTDKMWENINEFMPAPFKISVSTEKAIETSSTMMGEWFSNYKSVKKITRESLIKRLDKQGLLKKNDKGQFVFRKYDSSELITSTDEAEFVDKVLKYEQGLPSKRIKLTTKIKSKIKEAIKNGINNTDFPSPSFMKEGGSATWLQDTLSPFCNKNWEVVDNEVLESFGVIMVKTVEGFVPEQCSFIKVSTNPLTADYRQYQTNEEKANAFMSRKGLTGKFEPDVDQQSRSNSLMVEAVNGNLEMMETMLLINQLSGMEGKTVGSIQVVNPYTGSGLGLSNEELIYSWRELNKHKAVSNDKISNGNIKFATKYEIARQKFDDIMAIGKEKNWKDGYQLFGKLRTCQTILDENIDSTNEEKIAALTKLLHNLTASDNMHTLDKVYSNQHDLKLNSVDLYNSILMAIAQLKGINFRQQLHDHDKWVESFIFWKDGVSGTYIDNPGNMNSETLNLVTNLVTEAYQNVRDEIQQKKPKIQELLKKLKEEKQFGALKENTIGNQVSLYENMFREYTPGGDFLFKNPNELYGAEREFLEYVLDTINRNRYPLTDEELENMKNSDDPKYYRVPLAVGGEDSIASSRGLLQAFRAKLSYLNPKVAFQKAREKVEGVFNADEDIASQQKSELIYRMTNMFDGGEDVTKRMQKLESKGVDYFEHNLETLLYKHIFAYSVKNNMDSVFPMIKAAMVHLCTQGAIQNHKFSGDIDYFTNYIRNKIYNQSIIDPKLQDVAKALGLMKSAASKLTLAFAPVQALYQPLQGLWTDISLMIRKPDGKESFTFQHFTRALKMVYSDLTHYSDSPTLCSSLNELYGINDMDINTYTERVSSAKKGFWNYENFMFKFASRPDFYNRMSIFLSQMMGDGCLEAHSVVNGKLVYDWTKDKRFDLFAAGKNKNSAEYKKQEAYYYAVAIQFAKEHAKVLNPKTGKYEEFKVDMSNPMPLPRAYTNKQAEAMKSLGDNIYGYYSHEKKSLIMSTTLGSLWLQFKTYWSGKKNQYLQSGGVRLQGKWEQYEENGEKYYYQVDSKGNTLFNEPPLSETAMKEKGMPLVAPLIQWKGQWQEGIVLTLAQILKTATNEGLLSSNFFKAAQTGFNSVWNNSNENIRLAQRNNLKQLLYDIGMFIIGGCVIGALLGDWLKDLKKDNKKNRDFLTGLGIAAANVAVLSVKNSFLDFNAAESIGGAVGSWTPFSFEWTKNTLGTVLSVATGDEDIVDGIVKSSGALKQIKPAIDAIKPDMFRTKAEGGTFDVD